METAFHFSKVLKDRDGNADHGGELARVKVRFVPLHALSSACAALLKSGSGLTPPRFSLPRAFSSVLLSQDQGGLAGY